MQHEFNNRMNAQRRVLRVVNTRRWSEDLFGISEKAIERWSLANQLPMNSKLVQLVLRTSENLLFLANRSHEQVTDEYSSMQAEIEDLCSQIEAELVAVP